MIRLLPWTERSWSFDLPIGAFPALLERIRGTPARAQDLVLDVEDDVLSFRPGGAWCVKEHIGHLDDLDDLDTRRLAEYLAGAEQLSAADMSNRRTNEANHQSAQFSDIIMRFKRHRSAFLDELENLTEAQIATTALHPRLKRSMRLIDWIQFVAEHDDHHLAKARETLRTSAKRSLLASGDR